MAHDLYLKKDKMELAKTNPRSQSFGAMSSGELQYKNYLAGMKPRVKTPPENDRSETTRIASNNFRLSVNDLEDDVDKVKASRALYTEMSSVPTKRTTNDLCFEKGNKPMPKPKPKMVRNKSSSFDKEDKVVKNDAMLSVGKLRSMFDGPSNVTINNTSTLQLRNNDTSRRRRDNFKRYSALEPLQSPKKETKKIDVNIGRVKLNVDAMVNDGSNEGELSDSTVPKSTLNIDAMLSLDDNETEVNGNDKIEINSTTETENNSSEFLNNSTASSSKTKGMHGLLQRKRSEFDDFEDRVVPTGTKTIDISSLLAPAPADDNNNHQENISENQNEQSVVIEFDLQKKRELDRLIQAQQEVNINKAFNVKRRSLKDKLSEMCSMSQDSFDQGVVPYESVGQPIEKPSINIDSYINQSPTQVNIEGDNSKISSTIDTDDKHCEIINESVVICDSQESISPKVVPAVDSNKTFDGNKINDLSIECSLNSEAIVYNKLCYVDGRNESGLPVEVSCETFDELNIEIINPEQVEDSIADNDTTIDNNVTIEIEKLEGNIVVDESEKPEKNNIQITKPELTEIKPNKMNILLTEPIGNDSGDDSEDLPEDKPYESIVDRFDAFLTSHGIADPDILSPVPISDVEMDAKVLTGIIDGKLETSDDLSSSFDDRLSNAGSNDLSLIDDEISNDISGNLSLADEKLSTDIFDELSLLVDDKISNNISDDSSLVDDISLGNFHPVAHSSQDDLTNKSLTANLEDEPIESLSVISTDVENKGLESNDNNFTLENEQCEVKPIFPKIYKQDKVDLQSPTECEIVAISEIQDTLVIVEKTVAVNDMQYAAEHNDKTIDGMLVNESNVPESVIDVVVAPETCVEELTGNTAEDPPYEIITSSVEAPSIIMENKDIPNIIDVEPILVNATNIVDVASTENAVVESNETNSSKIPSAHQLLANLATLDSDDKVVSDQISVSANIKKEKLSVSEPREKHNPSSSSNNDHVNVVVKPTQDIKTQLSLIPKKSNLTRSKGGGSKKVNFKDPFLNDVILTYGPMEYDRANADIDPISSSAEWELEKRVDKMDVFSVDLQKDERGLGLSIIGLGVGTETGVEKLGIFVKTLTENGASQKDGRIQVNDQILEVNGISLVGVTQYFAAQTLKNTDGVVRFLMGREKSRRSQYSPGSPLAGNPEMHKHIEEMNKVLQQVDEFEDRAMNAESTLEEVKLELLKAEERAHDAEHQLKDTKEQLTAVTESPFVGSTRKLKNEIKKKGGKHGQMDTLQRSLTDVTNRLSTSEDNLTELQNRNGNKDNQIAMLQQKISDQDNQLTQMENSNKFLHNEIGCKVNEINTLRLENGQLKEQLNEINEKHDKEKENLARVQIEMAVKTQGDVEEIESTAKILENENKCLKDEILALSRRLEINEQLLKEVTGTEDQSDEINLLQHKLSEHKAELENTKEVNCNMQADLDTLKEKNEYLQSLIMKLERREEMEPEKIDIELKFKEKEDEYIQQNDTLRAKISELEEQIRFPQTTFSNELSPTLPIRGYVNVNELSKPVAPPEFSRETKPNLTKEPTVELQINLSKIDDETNLLSNDSGIESINNIDDIEVVVAEEVNTNLSPNPVPKPERGNFITINTELSPSIQDDIKSFIFNHSKDDDIKHLLLEPTEFNYPVEVTTAGEDKIISDSALDLNVSLSATVSANGRDIPALKDEDVKLDVGTTEEIITDKVSLSSTSPVATAKNLEKNTDLRFDLDDLPEGKIDNDSDEDQGQFQLIHEEIEEEQQTPAPTNRAIRMHSDVSNDRKLSNTINGDLDSSIVAGENFDQWLDKDWSRLDSTAREECAEKIAAEVSANTPTARKFSSTSSTSSEEATDIANNNKPKDNETDNLLSQRAHSIKIDSSYFEQSQKNENSFDDDGSIDVLDQSVDDDVIEISPKEDETGDLIKCTSFDSAIPPTAILDNKVALDKKAVMNNQRAKPSRSPRVAVSANVTVREADGSESHHTSTLPRPGYRPKQNKLQAAQSVPDLSRPEKHPKRKHKYVFHLPKAFKKSKLGKKLTHDSINKNNKEVELSLSDNDLASYPEAETISEEGLPSHTPSINAEADVVPMEEKTAALNQERANDAATEEAVVPFADKEMLMTTSSSDPALSLHIRSDKKGSHSPSPPSPQNPLSLEVNSSPSLSSESETRHGSKLSGQDEIGSINSSNRQENNSDSMEIEFSSFTASPVEGSTSPEFYNERGVDVEMTNGHSEVDVGYKTQPVTQWDVRQVGLWMAEINMNAYVNGFKSHNVDGLLLLHADGRELKEYGVHNHDHRSQIKKHIKEFRVKFGKGGATKLKDHKTTKDKLQFWKGKYKLN